jgi:serine/threonine protein kinase/Flp pilus assembly protein TadD
MTPERWQQINELYHAAVELDANRQATFLNQACAGDAGLRDEVESLIASHDQARSFIAEPALKVAARVLAEDQVTSLVGRRFSHYRIESLLGVGGMGEVYLAEDTSLDRKVALKLLPAQFTNDAERLRRFEREARAASALNHPNILTIYEIGQEDGHHYTATEFIDGETLREHMAGTRMKVDESLDVAAQVASALGAAHAAGIVHRDIKPENVMLRSDGFVKVLDFGLAKLSPRHASMAEPEAPARSLVRTNPGLVMGTVRYMSPEQARGQDVDARTDIWSLGVVIYEMVTGRAPFAGETPSHVVVSILETQPPPLTHENEMPKGLERIVDKALRKNREERYQTVKDLLLDLKSLKQELEVEAHLERSAGSDIRPSSAEYLFGEIKRHKRGAVFAAAAMIIVVTTFVYSFYLKRGGEHLATSGEPIDSMAVLPFVNESGDPNTEYLADGISESLINSLSQLPGVKVIARSSTFKYKGKEVDLQEVANTLGVKAILTGRVTQRGDNLLISVELADARDKTQVWGGQYTRKSSDLLAVQAEISQEIADRLRLQLSGAERQQLVKLPTENLKAFQYYMQGRAYAHRRTREDLLAAIRYCEKAIEEDHNYALAYAGLADAYTTLGSRSYIAPQEGRGKAEEAAHKALALDENLAEAHAALGSFYVTFAPYNFLLSDRELRRAIELSPSLAMAYHFLGVSLARRGHLDEGLEELLKARELDPLSSIIARSVGLPYYLKRDYGRALELLRQANELGPAFTTVWEIGVYTHNQLFDEALAELEKAKQERKDDPLLIYSTGMVYAAQGRRVAALQIIKELEEMSGASLSQAQYVAKIYAALNEKELALTWLERSLAPGAIGAFFKDEPVWDPIRSDPRFADLLRRMGITGSGEAVMLKNQRGHNTVTSEAKIALALVGHR